MEIYVHVPFCVKKCDYCDFYSLSHCQSKDFDSYLNAVKKEIRLSSTLFADREVNTVFIGGGTPSYIGGKAVASILNEIKDSFRCALEEVTVECNPESATAQFFEEVRLAGVNRVSIGVQSLSDENLRAVGRVHDKNKALDTVKLAKSYFDNISVDFIVGLPYDSVDGVKTELEEVAPLVEHLSCYELILDSSAPLFKKVKSGQIILPDDDAVVSFFDVACETLRKLGFERYEISNFARNGRESKHNVGYWTREEYLGFGPSAHSYFVQDGKEIRQNNVYDLAAYVQMTEKSDLPFAAAENVEILTSKDVLEEKIYLGLRISKGISKSLVDEKKLQKYADFLRYDGDVISLNDRGMSVMDTIVTDLLP